MASTPLNDVEKTGESEMEAGRQTEPIRMEIATLEHFGNLVERCCNTDPSDPDFELKIKDVGKCLTIIFEGILEVNKEELNRHSRMIGIISSKCKDNLELSQQIFDWCKSRKKLIKITEICADELDQNIQVVYLSQMLGLTIEILNSLNLGVFQKLSSFITSWASNISPNFGLIMECALPLVPYLNYMGIVSSFLENLRSEVLIRRVVKAMQEDKEKFMPLKKWFDETSEFEDAVQKLFPYENDENIIEGVEKYLKDLNEERKVFVTAVILNTKKVQGFLKHGTLLSKIAFFSRSYVGQEWRKRLLGVRPLSLDCSLMYFRSVMLHLEEIDAKPEMAKEYGKYTALIQSILPRILFCGMNSVSVYFCYKKIKSQSKHSYSFALREFVKNAESFLDDMEDVRRKKATASGIVIKFNS